MISYYPGTDMATATYICDTGHTLTGTISSITCNKATRQWSSTERSTCELICPDLTIPAPLVYSDTTIPRDDGSMATYTCDTGYQVTGLMMRMCSVSGWSTAICPVLTLSNGFIVYDPNSSPVLEGAMATHACVTGYQLSLSPATRICQSDRMWSGDDITCELICPNLGVPTNGGVTYSDTTIPRAMDSTATYLQVLFSYPL
ncbi:CUB and sushi domain-containing protein 2-like [Halichondria panicea]|uniref:CUB and sushi domain-containing protein 2-like n=1 Tax=Halichondria panicea TaxID=6063 RepID=UPI00312BC470